MKKINFFIGLLVLLAVVFTGVLVSCNEVEAKELRFPYQMHSHHTTGTGFNEKHRTGAIEYVSDYKREVATVTGAMLFKDSYNMDAFVFKTGGEVRIASWLNLGAVGGVAYKGFKMPGLHTKLEKGVIPFIYPYIRLHYGWVGMDIGFVPVPETLGSSVAFISYGLRKEW